MPTDALPEGTLLHGPCYRYRLGRALGQGTFGITYVATIQQDDGLRLYVAVKEFFMRDVNGRSGTTVTSGSTKSGLFVDYRKKFVAEAEHLAKLSHPGIIKVVESWAENGTVYYAMEYVAGGSLDDMLVRKGPLDTATAARIGRRIGEALQYMHSRKMLHLDLKPANVMMQDDDTPLLIDFGLSKQYDRSGIPESSTGVGQGTPGYAPSEQAVHRDGMGFPVTMDVYALGGTLFKMLTGKCPPDASIILNDGFPREKLQHRHVDRWLIDVIERAMQPKKADRYQTVAAMISALTPAKAAKPSTPTDPTTADDCGRYRKREGHYADPKSRVVECKVTGAVAFPRSISIEFADNSKQSASYYVELGDEQPARVKVVNGSVVKRHQGAPGIPADVKRFIKEHGLLSSEHWEFEGAVRNPDPRLGYTVAISLNNGRNDYMTRRVTQADHSRCLLLYTEIYRLLFTTSIASLIKQARPAWDNTTPGQPLQATSDAVRVVLELTNGVRGVMSKPVKVTVDRKNEKKFQKFAQQFNGLGLTRMSERHNPSPYVHTEEIKITVECAGGNAEGYIGCCYGKIYGTLTGDWEGLRKLADTYNSWWNKW